MVTVVLVGVVAHRLGDPTVLAGHQIDGPDQVVVDKTAHVALGSRVDVGRHPFTVVGLAGHRTLTGGIPVLYIPLAGAQAAATGGQPIISAVVATGTPGRYLRDWSSCPHTGSSPTRSANWDRPPPPSPTCAC